ncbi:helix-turn-helix domain-containing protein [Sulfuritortus calidifontis]|uniref:helix-turn-helix domain-containing protein n=1 Tax=Sulfuritortus calidifontis TaxID=1914471 RepID=UPI001404EF9B|nr:helix-turn-helix domain-containing protein [Sulfuritortus calidifontis]
MKTLDLHAAADLLHIHPVTLREKARCGEIPGAKIGKSWVFVDVDLIDYIRAQYPARVMQGDRQEKSECHSTSVRTLPSGGSSSATLERSYKEVLGLTTS